MEEDIIREWLNILYYTLAWIVFEDPPVFEWMSSECFFQMKEILEKWVFSQYVIPRCQSILSMIYYYNVLRIRKYYYVCWTICTIIIISICSFVYPKKHTKTSGGIMKTSSFSTFLVILLLNIPYCSLKILFLTEVVQFF